MPGYRALGEIMKRFEIKTKSGWITATIIEADNIDEAIEKANCEYDDNGNRIPCSSFKEIEAKEID